MAIWQTLKSAIVGVGVGEATADALTPILTPAAQDAWAKNPYKALAAQVAAELVAQGLTSIDQASVEAALTGYNADRLMGMIQLQLRAPSVAEGLTLRRRKQITPEQFSHIKRKARLEPEWDQVIDLLLVDRLDPAIIATAIQRGIMAAPFQLPYDVNVPIGNVTPFAVSPLDAAEEAAANGIDVERLRIETALVGLPMALDRAARARFRNILTEGDYLRAVLEGNARGEWAQAELDVAREILTANQYSELELRGYYDRTQRLENTAKHGMSEQDSDWLYDVLGRGLSLKSAFIGWRRGGSLNGPTTDIPDWALYALQRGNLRPEVYNLAWAQHETYPSAFVIRALLKDGAIGADEGHSLLNKIGWPDALSKLVADHYAAPTATGTKKLTAAQIRATWKAGSFTPAQAIERLQLDGYSPADAQLVFDGWQGASVPPPGP